MKGITILFSLLLSMVFISCEEYYGYPHKIRFPSEGGTQTFIGCCSPIFFEIMADSKEYYDEDIDGIPTASNEWLTVKSIHNSLIVTAKPAPSNKKRKATIDCDFGCEGCEIDVVQGK